MRTLKRSECAVLSLVLKGKWYDAIEWGGKREEYRACTPYWETRLKNWAGQGKQHVIEFRDGYAHNAPRMAFTGAMIDLHETHYSKREWARPLFPWWGEPPGPHYVIPLDERVELED